MTRELIAPRIQVRGGRVEVPDGPGLGVAPDCDDVARHKIDSTTITA
jgi:L-alanine-DL-glutamate epimerase-like enolase superfamily enzyme